MMFSDSIGRSQWVTGTITYSGVDNGAGERDPRPNSDAAAVSFDAAVGSRDLITFEGLPVGNFASLPVAPGVTVTLTNTSSDACAGIANVNNTDLGYNTTAGGQNHLRVAPGFDGPDVSVTFAFASPIGFFGAYLTGTEMFYDGSITLNFNDGTKRTLLIPKNNFRGGVQFYGFTTFGMSISSVTFQEAGPFTTQDIWGIDDVRYGPPAGVTRSPTMLLLVALD